jgi:hypothetical protein
MSRFISGPFSSLQRMSGNPSLNLCGRRRKGPLDVGRIGNPSYDEFNGNVEFLSCMVQPTPGCTP